MAPSVIFVTRVAGTAGPFGVAYHAHERVPGWAPTRPAFGPREGQSGGICRLWLPAAGGTSMNVITVVVIVLIVLLVLGYFGRGRFRG